jgi:hypothetical protein
MTTFHGNIIHYPSSMGYWRKVSAATRGGMICAKTLLEWFEATVGLVHRCH